MVRPGGMYVLHSVRAYLSHDNRTVTHFGRIEEIVLSGVLTGVRLLPWMGGGEKEEGERERERRGVGGEERKREEGKEEKERSTSS